MTDCPHCGFTGQSQPYGMNPEIHECIKCTGTWFDDTSPIGTPIKTTFATAMNEILAQLIAAAIDPAKIPALDYFDMERRDEGVFVIVLNDGTCIKITVEQLNP
jgi:hypothetical protein